MEIKRGTAVSPGVAIGPALVLDTEWFRIPQRTVAAAERDAAAGRLRRALDAAASMRAWAPKMAPNWAPRRLATAS